MSMKILVGGQMEKQRIADMVKQLGGDKVEVAVKSDIEAAMMVKSGAADYYFGCCATGGGGSLASAIAILGYGNCLSISMPGIPPEKSKVETAIKEGKKAFGFTDTSIDAAVPMLMELLLNEK